WPTLELARATSLPGNLLQRLDVVFLAVWVTAVFTTIFSSYMFTVYSMSKFLKLKNHKLFTFFILPIVFVIAMIPQDTVEMYQIISIFGRLGLIATIVIPIILLFIAKIRKLKAKRERNNVSKTIIRLYFIILLFIPMLSGCWDSLDLEKRATILSIAIDKADPDANVEHITHFKEESSSTDQEMIRLTAQISVPGRIPLGPE